MTSAETEQFYERLVERLRSDGVVCAITSGMACVHYGIVQATNDCDLVCLPDHADRCLDTVSRTLLEGTAAAYRGAVSAPLDARWLRGGWTSHFCWTGQTTPAYLDIFGRPPRVGMMWAAESRGLYAGLNTVAEMKHTQRPRDWPVASALGLRLLEEGDPRGWLHIFDLDVLQAVASRSPCPLEMAARRPVLQLLLDGDPRLKQALRVEQEFWLELDRQRLALYQRAVRPYASAVRRAGLRSVAALAEHHAVRVECALRHLSTHPLQDYGYDKLHEDVHDELAKLFAPALLQWLPDLRETMQEDDL